MRRSELGRQKEQENDRNLKKSQDRIVSLKSSPMFELNRIFSFYFSFLFSHSPHTYNSGMNQDQRSALSLSYISELHSQSLYLLF